MSFGSFVDDHGEYASRCGYCKRTDDSSVAHGLWAHRLTVHDYQELLDRGWRRSGAWLYKPALDKTCCPPYTIRLKADAFQPSKEHKKVLARFNHYLEGKRERGPKGEGGDDPPSTTNGGHAAGGKGHKGRGGGGGKADPLGSNLGSVLQAALDKLVASGKLPKAKYPPMAVRRQNAKGKGKGGKHPPPSIPVGGYSSASAFAVAAVGGKAGGAGGALSPEGCAALLVAEVARLSPESQAEAAGGYINFGVESMDVDTDTEGRAASGREARPSGREGAGAAGGGAAAGAAKGGGGAHKLEVKLVRSEFTTEEFDLYCRYQVHVHGDDPSDLSEASYCRFLVDTPLAHVPRDRGGEEDEEDGDEEGKPLPPSCGYGSFHQQYRIDGKLVAVGVVDVLPRCLSSKYLFWDPDYAHLSLGKYSALREIEWVTEAKRECPTLEYYYLGYYIHKCPKMRYKAQYSPAELLCPVRYTWCPYAEISSLLDEKDLVVLSDHAVGVGGAAGGGGGGGGEDAVEGTPLLIQRKLLRFKQLVALKALPAEAVEKLVARLKCWHELCGPTAARMVYLLS